MIPTQSEIDEAVRELVLDGTPLGEVWEALVERFGDWRGLDFRLRVPQRELDERALREEMGR